MNNQTRISILDELRGLSILGIMLTHLITQYVGILPELNRKVLIFNTLDRDLSFIIGGLLGGKFFLIFSLLFGVTFWIQVEKKRGQFNLTFIIRLLVLAVIGFAHYLFFQGDILIPYALLGGLLLLCQKASDKILMAGVIFLLSGIPRFILFFFSDSITFNPENIFMQNYLVSVNGTWKDVALLNLSNWATMIGTFQLGYLGRAYQIFACFLLGIVLYRRDFFSREVNRQKGVAKVCGGVLVLSVFGLFFCYKLHPKLSIDSWTSMMGLTFYDWFNFSLSGLLILLYKWGRNQNQFIRGLALVGRMSLTHYIFQSLFFTFFFFNWGLGFFGKMGVTLSLLLGLVFFGFQVGFSFLWFRKFKRGPLESLWRHCTPKGSV